MSGIAGIIHLDGRPASRDRLETMASATRHRGPDALGYWLDGPAALVHCMLRTTPESHEECQPLANEDRSIVLVMDGRVDNSPELRRALLTHGARLRTRSDAELVLRAYEIWREQSISRIDGDFAFVVWDSRRRRAFCARDRLGNRPFNYCLDGETLLFASELQAILRLPEVPRVPNDDLVAEFVSTEWRSREHTLWRGIQRLVPATTMSIDSRGVERHVYWRPEDVTMTPRHDEEYVDEYRSLLMDTVRRQSRSAEPIAVEVSGGLDSSAVFAVAERLRRDGSLGAPGVEGYTLAFRDGGVSVGSPGTELEFAL